MLPPVAVSVSLRYDCEHQARRETSRRQTPVGKGSYLRNERIEIEVYRVAARGALTDQCERQERDRERIRAGVFYLQRRQVTPSECPT